MSDTFWLTLSANLLALATLVGLLLKSLKDSSDHKETRAIAARAEEAVTNGLSSTIKAVEHNTNGIKDELVKATALAEFAKGVIAGEAKAKAEMAAKDSHGPKESTG